MLSFVVPAYNEAQAIGPTLRALTRGAAEVAEPFEIIVVDDASTDGTAALAREAGATVVPASARHIAAARNIGGRAARGDVLFFVDADTLVSAEVIRAALAEVRRGAVGGGARVRFDGAVPGWARPATWLTLSSFRLLNLTVGCFMFCTRDAFLRTGGFNERLFAAEEVAFSVALKRLGRVALLDTVVVTSARKFRTHSLGEFLRTFWLALAGGAVFSRGRLALWYGDRRHDPGPR